MVSLGVHLCGGPIPVLSDLAPETRDSGRGVVRGDPLSSVLEKVWEPLKRPGRGSASMRLTRGAQLAPLEYTRVQAVTVICIGSQAEDGEEEEEVVKLRSGQGR